VIIIAYQAVIDAEARTFRPRVVQVDASNKIRQLGDNPAAADGPGLLPPPYASASA
jgi:aspartate 1-decarboxylase